MIAFIENKAKHFLSDKKVTIAIVALAIIGRVIQLIYFYNIRVDASFQVMGTQNFVYGHGITVSKVLPSDLSVIIYDPLINWPPGYSFLLAPFYILFNHNYIAAGLALDILSAITLILITRGILKILDTPVYLLNIYTLLNGFFIYYFYFIASSDPIAITFFLIAFYFTLLLIKSNQSALSLSPVHRIRGIGRAPRAGSQRLWTKKTIGIIVSLFICGLIKYLFIPIVFVIPLFLVLKGFADHNRIIKKAGFLTFLILGLSLAVVLTYQKYISGSATYISSPGRGFYAEHLLAAYPFVPASIIKPDSIALLFHQPGLETFVYHIFQWIHLLFILFVLLYLVWKFIKQGFKGISVVDSFMYLSFFISLAITLLLMALSVRVAKEEIMTGVLWTYVEEPRYYGLPCVLFHMAVFVIYQYYRANHLRFLKFMLYFFILSLLPEMFRGIVFDIRRLENINKKEYSWQYENRFQKYADSIIENEKKKYSTNRVVVTGSSYYYNHRVILYSHVPVLHEVNKINDLSSLNTKTPVLLLIILLDKDLSGFKSFLSMKGKEVAGKFNGFSFYSVYVTPH